MALGHKYWPLILLGLYWIISLPLFLYIYDSAKIIIDEEFHLRQGMHYCNKEFDVWDKKITTFPGLYMAATFLIPFGDCTTKGLRSISLIAGAFNIVLLYKIRTKIWGFSRSIAALDAFIIAFLPPLYFFNHVYYTDVLSLTMILLFYYNWTKDHHLLAAIFGGCSVLMRQTNVVYVAMICGMTALDDLTLSYSKRYYVRPSEVRLFSLRFWRDVLTSPKFLLKRIVCIIWLCRYYIFILIPFVAFVILNGSIVVGDKDKHQATLNLPQLLYFSIFALFFNISNTLENCVITWKFLKRVKYAALLALAICLLIVKYNTEVHEYLLADNRHFIFYIWNRSFGRYNWFKYAITPAYVFALALMYISVYRLRDSFKVMFSIALIFVLCLQKLLELRYFLIPYIIYRLNIAPTNKRSSQMLELFMTIIVNCFSFYIFFSRIFPWEDFEHPQRIIW